MAALSQYAVQSWLEDDVIYMASSKPAAVSQTPVAPAAPSYQIPIKQASTYCPFVFDACSAML
jgi:hypothetical protein